MDDNNKKVVRGVMEVYNSEVILLYMKCAILWRKIVIEFIYYKPWSKHWNKEL